MIRKGPTSPFITLSQTTLTKNSQPIYAAVRDMIAEKIRNQELKPGDRLPPDMDLAKSLGNKSHYRGESVESTSQGRAFGTIPSPGNVC